MKQKEAKGGGGGFGGFGGFGGNAGDTAKDKVHAHGKKWISIHPLNGKWLKFRERERFNIAFLLKGGSPTPKPSTIMSESKGGEDEEMVEFDTSPLEAEMKEAMEIK